VIRMRWKRTASLTLSQTTHSGSSLIAAEDGTSRLPRSPRHHQPKVTRRWPPARAARLQLVWGGFRRAAKTKSGGRASCPPAVFWQRLALDAVFCGGLIRGRGAHLRIRHRLAPLPLAAPRDAALAAPPASISPIAESRASPPLRRRHRAASGAAASGRRKASCQPQRRHPCRRASAALVAAGFEIAARGGGFVSPPGLAGLRSRGGGSQGLILSPVRRVPRPLLLRSARLQAPVAPSSVFSGAAGSRLRHGIRPLLAAASCRRRAGVRPLRPNRQVAGFSLPKKRVSPLIFPKN